MQKQKDKETVRDKEKRGKIKEEEERKGWKQNHIHKASKQQKTEEEDIEKIDKKES